MNWTYELFEDGYYLLNDGQKTIAQGGKYGNYFPYLVRNKDGSVNYEESAKAHIQALIEEEQNAIERAEQEQLEKVTKNDLEEMKLEILMALTDLVDTE